jgi:hypothetical protein
MERGRDRGMEGQRDGGTERRREGQGDKENLSFVICHLSFVICHYNLGFEEDSPYDK